VFLNPNQRLERKNEEERYQKHNNDIHSKGYQKFVKPMVVAVKLRFSPSHSGLDYGAGPGPVVSYLLENLGYSITKYDPFFFPSTDVLNRKFDFIICSEVAEHFYNPYLEFQKLKGLLKPNGALLCFTELFNDEITFDTWHYKNDETHVFFYHPKAIDFITNEFYFSNAIIEDRLVVFNVI
jgi:SAM-dependent methyltransferase